MAADHAVGQVLHLVGRFFGAIRPGPPAADDEAWAIEQLGLGEQELWRRMNNPDRRHAVGVAREVAARWPDVADADADADTGSDAGAGNGAGGPVPPRPVLAAALLHDVGKVDSGLRTPARVVATLVWGVLDDAVADRWVACGPSDPRSRLARYRRHPEIGGRLLRQAGADPLTAAWAEEHHRPEDRWTVDPDIGRVLKECDDD